MEIELSKVICTIINFLILFFILKHFFFNKLEVILKERQEFIDNKIKAIEEKEEKAESLLIEREKLIEEAKFEGKKIVEKRKVQGDKIYDDILEKAKLNASEIEKKKLRELELSKEKAREDLKRETVTIAISLSEKIVEKKLDDNEQKEIIDSFIRSLEV